MPLLLALFLVVHGGIHVGYVCGRSWPFAATDPWLVTGVGASSDAVSTVAVALVLVTFFAYLFAALTIAGIVLPRILWAPPTVVGSVASAVLLVVFVTPGTLPGLAIDAVLLWATVVRPWRPRPFFGRHRDSRRRPESVADAR
jgi:hypothetical protein